MKRVKESHLTYTGYDIHYGAIKAAKSSVKKALLDDYIKIYQKDFFKSHKPKGPTFLVFNPPYGERLKINSAAFHKQIGDTLKQSYAGATAWVLTADMEGLKHVGLRTSKRMAVKNGALDCKFVRYDMYEGSKKGRVHSP